jgi:ferredoxin-thioredoxin reductase catalytic subunit
MDKPAPGQESKPVDDESERIWLKDSAERWADEHGYELSKDADIKINELLKRKKELGMPYCPCRAYRKGDDERNKTIVCPCSNVHDDIARKGRCHCNLFVKKRA